MTNPEIYKAIIEMLFPDELYSPYTIPDYGRARLIHPFEKNEESKENRHIALRMRYKLTRSAKKNRFPPQGDGLLKVGDLGMMPAWYGIRWQKALGVPFPGWFLLKPFSTYSATQISAVLRPDEEANLDFFRGLVPREIDGRLEGTALFSGWRWQLQALKLEPEGVSLERSDRSDPTIFITVSCLREVLEGNGYRDLVGKLECFPSHADHTVSVSEVLNLCYVFHHGAAPSPHLFNHSSGGRPV